MTPINFSMNPEHRFTIWNFLLVKCKQCTDLVIQFSPAVFRDCQFQFLIQVLMHCLIGLPMVMFPAYLCPYIFYCEVLAGHQGQFQVDRYHCWIVEMVRLVQSCQYLLHHLVNRSREKIVKKIGIVTEGCSIINFKLLGDRTIPIQICTKEAKIPNFNVYFYQISIGRRSALISYIPHHNRTLYWYR